MLPTAMGAVVAMGNKPLVLCDGDASVMMHLAEFETAVRYAMPLLVGCGAVDKGGLRVIGSADPERLDDRLGVIAFNLDGVHHSLVAAILAYEGGIGVRNGCFCAHPYILRLLNVSGETYRDFRGRVLSGDRSDLPGLVRASFGCYNTLAEIDTLVEWLQRIRAGDFRGEYILDRRSGSYAPRGWDEAQVELAYSL